MAVQEKRKPNISDEDRAARSDRMKAMNADRRAQAAAVTDEQLLGATAGSDGVYTEEALEKVASMEERVIPGMGTISHRRERTVMLYDEFGRGRIVPSGNLRQLLQIGLLPRCPLCRHLPNAGVHQDITFNSCPGKEPLKYTICQVCAVHKRRKLIPDTEVDRAEEPIESDDPDYIPVGARFETMTVEKRLEARLYAHMWAFHPAESAMRGLPRPALGVPGR